MPLLDQLKYMRNEGFCERSNRMPVRGLENQGVPGAKTLGAVSLTVVLTSALP